MTEFLITMADCLNMSPNLGGETTDCERSNGNNNNNNWKKIYLKIHMRKVIHSKGLRKYQFYIGPYFLMAGGK